MDCLPGTMILYPLMKSPASWFGHSPKLAKLLTAGTSISFLTFGTLILEISKSTNLLVILNKKTPSREG